MRVQRCCGCMCVVSEFWVLVCVDVMVMSSAWAMT